MDDIENKEIINDDIGDEVPLLKPKRKMKKYPRTEKQQEAFKLIMQKRAENVAKRKEQKKIAAAKLLLSLEPSKEIEDEPTNEVIKKKSKPKKKLILSTSDTESEDDSDESDESEEKIYIARKLIKQPKKVYVIKKEIEEDEKPVNKFKSQQNKKSVVKISNNNNIIPLKNYFCD
jgi:hypothetical protein